MRVIIISFVYSFPQESPAARATDAGAGGTFVPFAEVRLEINRINMRVGGVGTGETRRARVAAAGRTPRRAPMRKFH
ncbi:hypothetical protein B5X24_HaOG209178 [Helicoverpa armigera]|nr:hypothetical protein B5X24_HaOG209178 [Helicoverpa armigera]